ncbi:hypothetical protein DDP48_06810, partial [Helicobacter pylori]
RSQRGSKAQELIAYLQKELESLPYSQKAIAKQVAPISHKRSRAK